MFDWLFEGHLAVYVTLAAAALVLLAAWWNTRRGLWVVGLALVLLAAGAYWLLDRLVVTDHEHVEQAVLSMADGVRAHSTDAVMRHVSERFRLGGMNSSGFRELVNRALQEGWVEEITVKDFEFLPASSTGAGARSSDVIRVSFRGAAWGGRADSRPFRCEADFVRDPDGQWRLASFQVFDPLSDSSHPADIPGLPR
jgi:hypothetical protein